MTFLCIGVLSLMSTFLLAGNGISIKFSPATYDAVSQTLHVDIEVKSENRQLILAGQNYRIFYNSSALSLLKDKAKLLLPEGKYSDIKFLDCQEGVDAAGAGSLSFDKNLGFINFSIDLHDNQYGGITLNSQDEWTSVATLRFKVLDQNAISSVVWGRDGVSHEYATAYVEMAEWLGPKSIAALDIVEFVDLNYQVSSEESSLTSALDISFAPNPAMDMIKLDFGNALKDRTKVTIRDYIGRNVLNSIVDAHTKSTFIDISSLSAGKYIIEVLSNDQNYSATKNLVKM